MSPKEFKDIKILNVAWVGQGDFGDEVMAFILRKFFQQEGARALTYYQQGRFTVYRSANDLVISHYVIFFYSLFIIVFIFFNTIFLLVSGNKSSKRGMVYGYIFLFVPIIFVTFLYMLFGLAVSGGS